MDRPVTCDLPSEYRLSQRVQTLRSAIADYQAGSPDVWISTSARRALETSSHFHGLLLDAAARTRDDGGTDDSQWRPASLAVDYLDAFARTHHRGLRADQSDDELNTDILTGDRLFSQSHELVLQADAKPSTRASCLRALTIAGRRLSEAAARHRELLQQDRVSFATYIDVLEQHGSALSRASTKLGGILTDVTNRHLEHLEAIGQNLGIALTLYATATQRTASGERAGDGHAADVPPSSIETAPRSVPVIASSTHRFERVTRALRHRAERHRNAISTHLDTLPDTTGSHLFSALQERIRDEKR